jgi:2-polyprenyl-3-methyl-5-hydroxy-6-metoxy-1,4-benzoquinol methylase
MSPTFLSERLTRGRNTRYSKVPAVSTSETRESEAELRGTSPETISTIEELDSKLREIDAAHEISDDKMREVFLSFKMLPPEDLPRDPYSPEYEERQFDLYRRISGRKVYEVDNEQSNFPVDPNRPFPYYTESPQTVGHHLMGIGFIIQTMGLSAGSSILELGAGWGNTTEALARMGYDVTAIDIDPTFVGLIGARAEKLALSIQTRVGDFFDIDAFNRKFDAVLFFECFHHCSDHRSLLRKLADVLEPGGRVFFAAEPISDLFPLPWGLRMDGESLWAIRHNGWLELGFQESYFVRTMQQLGWLVRKHETLTTNLGVIFEARRANRLYEMSTFSLPPDEERSWGQPDSTGSRHRYTLGRSKISLERGLDCGFVEIYGANPCPRPVEYRIEHGTHIVNGSAEKDSEFRIRIPYDPEAFQLVIYTDTWRPIDLLGVPDAREMGVAVATISLTD